MFKKGLMLILMCFACASYATQSTEFDRFEQDNIALLLPKNWHFASQAKIKEIKGAATQMLGQNIGSKTLLHLNSDDNLVGGRIRLSTEKLENEEFLLAKEWGNLSIMESLELQKILEDELKTEYARPAFQPMQVADTQIMLINQNEKMGWLTSYTRHGAKGRWQVNLYTLFDIKHNRKILLTLSYRLLDKEIIMPIFEQVWKSLAY